MTYNRYSTTDQLSMWPRSAARATFLRNVEAKFQEGCQCRLCTFFGLFLSGRMERELWEGYLAIYSTFREPHALTFPIRMKGDIRR